ncbi:MAG: M23 family metallopeptidase, partial [Schleiferiaceae bacterium]
MPKFLAVVALFATVSAYSQLITHPPLDGPLAVSGELAELRNHHFHSGIDLRTGGVTGKNVYAVADGWVRRIVVRPDGYGWALYLDHPSGHTTVYAHLDSFNPEIWAYVRAEAERRQAYRLDLYPPKGLLTVAAGTVLGASGNSGSSGGPHLHFEVRDRSSEDILDPVSLGLNVPVPSTRPKLWALQSERWRPAGDSLRVASWYDVAVTLPEQGFSVVVDDSLRAEWSLKRWSFDVQRGADAGLALSLHRQQGVRGFMLHPTPTQPSPGWRHHQDFPAGPGRYRLSLQSGGSTVWSGTVHVLARDPRRAQARKVLESESWTLDVPARGLAWDQAITFRADDRQITVAPDVAALKPVQFDWMPSQLADSLWDKTYLAVRDGRGSAKIPGTRTERGIRFTSKTLGSGDVRVDTQGPVCRYVRRDPNSRIWIQVRDELDVEIVRATVSGRWVWAYLDAKANALWVDPEGATGLLELQVQDELGNLTTFTYNL